MRLSRRETRKNNIKSNITFDNLGRPSEKERDVAHSLLLAARDRLQMRWKKSRKKKEINGENCNTLQRDAHRVTVFSFRDLVAPRATDCEIEIRHSQSLESLRIRHLAAIFCDELGSGKLDFLFLLVYDFFSNHFQNRIDFYHYSFLYNADWSLRVLCLLILPGKKFFMYIHAKLNIIVQNYI